MVTETFCFALEPMARLPKPRELEEADSCNIAATPLPLRGIVAGEFEALLTSVRLPENVPADEGANLTLKEEAPPGAMERGRASPDRV